jgi:hypothetical protein
MLSLRPSADVRSVALRMRRQGLWAWRRSRESGGAAEATNEEPCLRRRNRRSTNTVNPSQAKAAPKIRITAGIVSMLQCRCGSERTAYSFRGVLTTRISGKWAVNTCFLRSCLSEGPPGTYGTFNRHRFHRTGARKAGGPTMPPRRRPRVRCWALPEPPLPALARARGFRQNGCSPGQLSNENDRGSCGDVQLRGLKPLTGRGSR